MPCQWPKTDRFFQGTPNILSRVSSCHRIPGRRERIHVTPDLAIHMVWISIGLVWLAAASSLKSVARTEPLGSRLFHTLAIVPAFLLLFDSHLNVGVLNRRFVPSTSAVWWTGFALTLAGAALAIWARLLLGANWSATVTVKQNHELMQTGPYAIVRHPIYSGFLLAMLGTAIAFGEVRGLIALILAFIAWRVKSLIEERFMLDQFGEQYAQYKREVKALIPFVL
jgi:protein-S-isoprenylcysteine O-methyltransferase Ste14